MSTILIKNVNILTMNKDKDIIEKGVVVIKDEKIADVGNEALLDRYSPDIIIDGEDGILIPGMVNTHTHVSMTPFRSLGDDIPDRLKKYIFPLEKMLVDKELVKVGAKYGIVEMLLAGVTTFVDMYYFEDEVAKVAKELGIRGILGETIVNFVAPDAKEPYEGLEYSKWFIEKWKEDDLIIPGVAPHAPYTNDTIHLQKAMDLAKKYDVPMIMHVAEMDYEYRQYKEEYNLTPVQYLDHIGVLNKNLIAAHLVHVDDEDLELLKKKEVGIAHNVGANAKGAKGVCPAAKMYHKDMRIGLGTDGPMSGNTLDIITQMGLVGKIHKLFNKDRSLLPAREIVEMATIGGAKALHLEKEIGSIEVGKKADLVIMETQSINMQPIYDYYATLVYSANTSNVDTVIVDGKILVENKKLKYVDVMEITEDLKNIQGKILEIAKKL
ncbi:amidohydrolase [Crassaminicella profunda]|uniref:amidohydrolase n=1 Tax=Crassaminicella profunda TaxID=1286698 RepID=UPI001CA66FDC|nr:amidohydrolase [Crassaminicella profunda]QZY55217.1 amidohydrolase [Crassaminicella profunda]